MILGSLKLSFDMMNSYNLPVVLLCLCFEIANSASLSSPNKNSEKGKNWALLVAGSSGYENYQHQADICHAYHIVKHGGIPEDQIIVMMVDDIAYNEKNPTPGIILNYPNGTNVYEGVKIDYRGDAVTPKNFLHILSGNSDALRGVGNGKVIESGPDDIVFVNFVNIGSQGLFNFPKDVLTVGKLARTLNSLSQQRKFRKMIFFVEGCSSGSMFDVVISDELNIFAMTSTSPFEQSFSCYWDNSRNTFLGDRFSVLWMEMAQKKTSAALSLHLLFDEVRTGIAAYSHTGEYGNLNLGSTLLFEVLGNYSAQESGSAADFIHPSKDAISALDVPLFVLREKRKKISHLPEERNKIDDEIRTILHRRTVVNDVMDKIIEKITSHDSRMISLLKEGTRAIDHNILDCFDDVVHTFSNHCFNIAKNPFAGRSVQVFINACHMYLQDEKKILRAIQNTCQNMGNVEGIV